MPRSRPKQAKTKALQDRIDALYAALGIDEDADPNATIADLQTKANELEQMVADKEKADADAARMAMAATAAKLYAGIGAPSSTDDADRLQATYGDANNTPTQTVNDIVVTTGTGGNQSVAVLSEDKKAMVADNHGWEGQEVRRRPPAVPWSRRLSTRTSAIRRRAKFNSVSSERTTLDFQTADGDAGDFASDTDSQATARIASPSFDHDRWREDVQIAGSTISRGTTDHNCRQLLRCVRHVRYCTSGSDGCLR